MLGDNPTTIRRHILTTTLHKCTIRILNEVDTIFVGLKDHHLKLLYDEYGIHAPNYFFHPLYKLKRWDGKVRYFSMTGKTYTYLLEEILPKLKKLGYAFSLDDHRGPILTPKHVTATTYSHIIHPDTQEPITLYDYQYNLVNTLIDAGNGLVIAATGAGKTLFSAALCDAYGGAGLRTLTIVPNQDLIRNTIEYFKLCGLDTGEYSGKNKSYNNTHVVSTWQALKNYPELLKQFGMVLVDECHGAAAKVLQDLLKLHGAHIAHRFGITGTLPKDEVSQLSIRTALGPVRGVVTAAELIERGILATPSITICQLEEDLTQEYQHFLDGGGLGNKPVPYNEFKKHYLPDYPSEKAYLHRKPARIQWIVNAINTIKATGNTMVYVDSIKLARLLQKYIPTAIIVNGVDVKKPEDRQVIYDLFATRDDVLVIATVQIAGTGLNIRRMFNVVMLDIGKSFIRVIQSIGRGLRRAKDKDSVNIYDICSDLKYALDHLSEREAYYKEAKYAHKKQKIKYSLPAE